MSFYANDLDLQQGSVQQLQTSPVPAAGGWENISNVSTSSSIPSNVSLETSKSGFENFPFYHQFNDVEKAISNFTKHQPFNHHYAPNVHMNRNNRHNNNNNYNNGNGNGNNNHGNYNNNGNNNRYQHQNNNYNNHHQNNNHYNNNNNNNSNMMNNGNNQYKQYNNMNRSKHQQNGNNNNNMMLKQQQQFVQQQHQVPSRQQTPQQQLNFPQYATAQQYPQIAQSQGLNSFDIYSSPSSTPAHQLNQNLINSLRNTSSPSGFNAAVNNFSAPLEQINSGSSSATNGTGSAFGLSGSDILSSAVVGRGDEQAVNGAASAGANGFYHPDIWGSGSANSGNGSSVWA